MTIMKIGIFDELKEGEDEIMTAGRKLKKHMEIELFYVNINGLNSDKIKNDFFIHDIQRANIICLTETHFSDTQDQSVLENCYGFHTTVKKNISRGRNIKGVSVYVKEGDNISLLNVESLIKERGNLQILKLNSMHWDHLEDIFLIICYVDNRDSKYKDREIYENIKQYMIQFKMKNIIIIGDFNGRIGNETNHTNSTLPERESEDQIVNKMGKYLINFCNETSLIIANGRLENHSKGRCTYYRNQNNEIRKSVIDYLLISESMINYLASFEIMQPVIYTDHAPMQIKFQIELKSEFKEPKQSSDQNYNPAKWIKPHKWEDDTVFDHVMFTRKCKDLNNQILENDLSVGNIYNKLCQINSLCIKTNRKPIRKIVLSSETRTLRKHHRKIVSRWKKFPTAENLSRLMESKRNLNKKVKADRRKEKKNRLIGLKNARENNDHKRYWQLINENIGVKNIKHRRSILKASDFQTHIVINDLKLSSNTCLSSSCMPNMLQGQKCIDNLDDRITKCEIKNALRESKLHKTSGPDRIVYETLSLNEEQTIETLETLYSYVFNHADEIPWSSSWITPIFKKGKKNDPSSYRFINLSSCIEKIMTKIINFRLNDWLIKNDVIKKNQTGFKKGSSALDNIMLVKEIMQVYKNTKRPLVLCFVDLSKAFDSIPKNRMIDKLRRLIPKCKILSVIISVIIKKEYKVLYSGKETQSFKLENGIPQGDVLSPTLFSIYINDFIDILNASKDEIDSVRLFDLELSPLIYADDILLMSESMRGLNSQFKILCKFCAENGLCINYEKTKIMTENFTTNIDKFEVSLNGKQISIEVVDKYKYLGMWISKNNRYHLEQLMAKGKQAAYLTAKQLKEFGQVSGEILKNSFEMLHCLE